MTDSVFGTPDADGWYEWKGNALMRPAGMVKIVWRNGFKATLSPKEVDWDPRGVNGGVLKWRPVLPFDIGKCANKKCSDKAREISPYCDRCEPDL